MVRYFQILSADNLFILYSLFEHIPETDITIAVSYSVNRHVTQELYVNVSWVELRSMLADLFNTIDGAMSIVVIAGAMASFYFPPMEDIDT
jgi:hypothetical protein